MNDRCVFILFLLSQQFFSQNHRALPVISAEKKIGTHVQDIILLGLITLVLQVFFTGAYHYVDAVALPR